LVSGSLPDSGHAAAFLMSRKAIQRQKRALSAVPMAAGNFFLSLLSAVSPKTNDAGPPNIMRTCPRLLKNVPHPGLKRSRAKAASQGMREKNMLAMPRSLFS